jgi:hypothetical protein
MQKKIRDCSSKLLAVNVIAFRLFGWNEEGALLSMKILGERRAAGENFDFESFIEEELKKANEKSKVNS